MYNIVIRYFYRLHSIQSYYKILSLTYSWKASSQAGTKESWSSSVTQSFSHLPARGSSQRTERSWRGSARRTWRCPYPHSQYLHSSKCWIRIVPSACGPLQHTHRAHVLHCKARLFNIDLSKSNKPHWFSWDLEERLWKTKDVYSFISPKDMTYFSLPWTLLGFLRR